MPIDSAETAMGDKGKQTERQQQQQTDRKKEVYIMSTIIYEAHCVCCGKKFNTTEMVYTPSPKRGMGARYTCIRCNSENEGYHTSNDKEAGTAKVNRIFCGIEMETSYTDDIGRMQMFEYGFIPTRDGSLESDGNGFRYGYRCGNTCEYVSPLMSGLNIASKFALTSEKLMQSGHMKINDSCGTHFHVSVDSMKNANGEMVYNDYIRRYYHSLFLPLNSAMKANPTATENLFGRYFNDSYAEEITAYSTPEHNRYLWVNLTNNSNIEFRLNKFVSAKQYQNLMKMEVEIVKCIITNFCEHFTDGYADIDSRRYFRIVNGQKVASKDAYRKHKADVTAKKLVAIYKKYAGI